MEADTKSGGEFGFDYLHKCVIEVINLDGLRSDAETMTTARLRAIIEGERSRIARVNKWNAREKPAT